MSEQPALQQPALEDNVLDRRKFATRAEWSGAVRKALSLGHAPVKIVGSNGSSLLISKEDMDLTNAVELLKDTEEYPECPAVEDEYNSWLG